MIRIGALISGSGTNLAAIMRACDEGRIDGKVVFVGSDKPDAAGLDKAARKGLPTFVVNYKEIIESYKKDPDSADLPQDFDIDVIAARMGLPGDGTFSDRDRAFLVTRAIAEARLLANMAKWDFDLLVLAGFMRKLTPYFIDRVNIDPLHPRIMNIHPAILPSFPGTDGYGDTFRYGCRVGGCTVHFIDYGEDTGPIIGQRCFSITPDDTIETVKEKGLMLEWELYPECIQLFAQNRLHLVRGDSKDESSEHTTRAVVVVR